MHSPLSSGRMEFFGGTGRWSRPAHLVSGVRRAAPLLRTHGGLRRRYSRFVLVRQSIQNRTGADIGRLSPPETNLCADPCRRSCALTGEKQSNMFAGSSLHLRSRAFFSSDGLFRGDNGLLDSGYNPYCLLNLKLAPGS